ncbi:aggregation-promoting factor C-terminal-like domain-containing protein [Agromyces bauzanensis]
MAGRWGRVGAAIVLVVALAMPAGPATAAEYPSWDEVEAAKADVATREVEATRITALVDQLEAEAGRLGDAAVEAAAVSASAESARVDAEALAGTLRTAADAAAQEATTTAAQLGRLGAVLARSGGADVTLRLLFDAGGQDDLLVGLSRAAQLANVYGGVAARARAARADAEALSSQADVAEAERTRLAREAAAAADAAKAAHEAAEAQVAAQQASLDTLYAQLASLRDRSVELERQFRIGEQAAREQAAREAAAAAAAAAAASSGGGGDGRGAPPPGVVVDRAAAKAYAASRLPAYGWGSEQFRCLDLLWTRESGWRADAYNASSGAYGIPQSLPGSKMASAGADWRTNAATQIDWGLSYISARYGSPCGAWAHSEAYNWY